MRLSKFERQIRKLRQIGAAIDREDDRMVRALREAFPERSIVEFTIRHGQINPSIGTVTGHCGGQHGYVSVRHARTGTTARVSFHDILRCTPQESVDAPRG